MKMNFMKFIDYLIEKIVRINMNKIGRKISVKEKESKLFRGIKGNKDKAGTVVQLSAFKGH